MPWKETSEMEQRVRFVLAEKDREGETFLSLCRRFNVSRQTGYKWLRRFREGGFDGLKERSRRPHRCPHGYGDDVRELVRALRRKYPTWGGKKLEAVLKRRHPDGHLPHSSTIDRWLRQEGLTRSSSRRRKHMPYFDQPLTQPELPNDVWYADFKGEVVLADGTRCYPLTVSDGASRFLLCCKGLPGTRVNESIRVFRRVFRTHGLPKVIRTDNGTPFAAPGLLGLTALSVWWLLLGIRFERIEKGRPDQNGVHERMHRTLKEDVMSPPAPTFQGQQRVFTRFRRTFNEVRPHEALGMKCPADVYELSPRTMPRRQPSPSYDDRHDVRKVSSKGVISFRAQRVHVGRSLGGLDVGLLQSSDSCWGVYLGTIRIGHFDDNSGLFEPYGACDSCCNI